MIVASVLLILVAVLFLALGLAASSSSLLIASIVASLLAAVALVIGARQAAANRRAGAPDDRGPAAPEPATSGGRDRHDSGIFSPAANSPSGPQPFAADSASSEGRYDEDPFGDPAHAGPAPADGLDGLFPRQAGPDGEIFAHRAGPDDVTLDRDAEWARAAGARDTADAHAARRPDPGTAGQDRARPDQAADAHAGFDREAYERASSAIDAARGDEPDGQAWRRPGAVVGSDAARVETDGPDGQAWRNPGSVAGADAVTADEFAEPDADDPDDEPLPQSVRPADAVLVARLDTEVLVVDGRPRYHMAECPHLVGRLTEPLPAAEAVELGFSPCGLCRPVDRLVAATARH